VFGEGDQRTHAGDPPEIPQDSQAAFFAGALLGIVLDWLRRGCPGSARQMSAAIWPLLAASAAELVPLPENARQAPPAAAHR
jgi:hypothetical protein